MLLPHYAYHIFRRKIEIDNATGISMFVAGNLSLLDYRTREEVVYVLHTVHMILFENIGTVESLVDTVLKEDIPRLYRVIPTRNNSQGNRFYFTGILQI